MALTGRGPDAPDAQDALDDVVRVRRVAEADLRTPQHNLKHRIRSQCRDQTETQAYGTCRRYSWFSVREP